MVNAVSRHQTPLHMAAMKQRDAVARLLVDFGADVYAENKSGLRPRALVPSHHSLHDFLCHCESMYHLEQKYFLVFWPCITWVQQLEDDIGLFAQTVKLYNLAAVHGQSYEPQLVSEDDDDDDTMRELEIRKLFPTENKWQFWWM